MQDHVRKLNFEFEKPQAKPHTYTTATGGTAPDFIAKKNLTETDPFNSDIKIEQHGDNVSTGYQHKDNPFQESLSAHNHTEFHVSPKFSRGKSTTFLFILLAFICAAIIVTLTS